MSKRLIYAEDAIDAVSEGILREEESLVECVEECNAMIEWAVETLKKLPSAQPEPLTDKEQRIFLAAMGREEKVCEEVDRNYTREPYEDSLVRVCREIERKVKGALWT